MCAEKDKQDWLRSEGDVNISAQRQAWIDAHVDDETRKWLELDEKYFLRQALSTPCLNVLDHCKGTTIGDLQGREFLDFHGNNVHQVGFANRHVIDAIKKQLDELSFCTRRYTNVPAVKLAEKLAQLAPGNDNKVLFAPAGTLAVGMAMKLARLATGRFKMISMWDSFHGASLDAISVGGEALFRKDAGPLLTGVEHVPPPDCYRCLWGCRDNCNLQCADYIEYVLSKEPDVAAVIAETVRSNSIIPPKGYWKKVRAACDKYGALLILDEIPHCMGRTGRMFTCEHYEIEPDMLVIGKSLGGGIFPLAALIAKEGLDVAADRAIGHYTHEKNPVACAAALAAIEYVQQEDLPAQAEKLGNYAMERLRQMKDRHSLIGEVRGLGLLIGMELVKDSRTKEPATEQAEQVMYSALGKGLNFKVTMGNIITLTPALTITKDQMDEALGVLDECLTEVERT